MALILSQLRAHGIEQLLSRKIAWPASVEHPTFSQCPAHLPDTPPTDNRNDADSGMSAAELSDGSQAVLIRHEHVEQDQISWRMLKLFQSSPALTSFHDRVTVLVQGPSKGTAETVVIIDNENGWHRLPKGSSLDEMQ